MISVGERQRLKATIYFQNVFFKDKLNLCEHFKNINKTENTALVC